MIHRFLELHAVYQRFILQPEIQDDDFPSFSQNEWNMLQNITLILMTPHSLQMALASDRTPTISHVVPLMEWLMDKWEELQEELPSCKEHIQAGLDIVYKYYSKTDDTDAYVLAMLINPHYRMMHIEEKWQEQYKSEARASILKRMREYRTRMPQVQSQRGSAPTTKAPQVPLGLRTLYEQADKFDLDLGARSSPSSSSTLPSIEEEYSLWIALGKEHCVDQLSYWQVNGLRWPTLHAMALDYLPVQATSVPCERAFSSSAETDTRRSSRIKPQLMEALQLLKFLIKWDQIDFTAAFRQQQELLEVGNTCHPSTQLAELFGNNPEDAVDAILDDVVAEEDLLTNLTYLKSTA